MEIFSILRALVLGALLRTSLAVLVAENSPCASKCGNVITSTPSDNVICKDTDSTTAAGIVWTNCLNCLLTSDYTITEDGTNFTDLQAMLYNMRYATSYCLFDYSADNSTNNHALGSNPCPTSRACGPLQAAYEYDSLDTNTSSYGYCSLWDSETLVPECSNCLKSLEGSHYLVNYLDILDGACKMQPAPGSTLATEGTLFSSDIVNVTAPTATATFSASGPSGPLSLGAIVGISIGGAAFLLGLAGFCIVTNGKRKRRAYLRKREQLHKKKNWPDAQGGGEMFETPVSQRPLRGWNNDSPVSAATESAYPRYFSPYSSQYNSPVSATDGPRFSNMAWPIEKTRNIGIALSPDAEYSNKNNEWPNDKKGKEKAVYDRDEYELQEGVNSGGGMGQPHYPDVPPPHPPITPTLGHPGYGRYGPLSMPNRPQASDDEYI